MKQKQNIIEDYRRGDAEKRLYLFLEHRELRNVFLELEKSNCAKEMGCA